MEPVEGSGSMTSAARAFITSTVSQATDSEHEAKDLQQPQERMHLRELLEAAAPVSHRAVLTTVELVVRFRFQAPS